MGINRAGNLVSWGSGGNGKLGRGLYDDKSTEPKAIDKSLFSKEVQIVICGGDHTCVSTTDGEVYSW